METYTFKNPISEELATAIGEIEFFESIDVMTDRYTAGIPLSSTIELSIMRIPEGFLYTTYTNDSHSTVFVPNRS